VRRLDPRHHLAPDRRRRLARQDHRQVHLLAGRGGGERPRRGAGDDHRRLGRDVLAELGLGEPRVPVGVQPRLDAADDRLVHAVPRAVELDHRVGGVGRRGELGARGGAGEEGQEQAGAGGDHV
jgi:hypothetical protein